MTQRLMLDTNIVSHIVRRHRVVVARLVRHPIELLCVSAITVGEIRFGLARQEGAHWLQPAMDRFLRQTEIMPWDGAVADVYGTLRAAMQRRGRSIGELDLLIAAHAIVIGAILVTNDAAFAHIPGLATEDWTREDSTGPLQ
jgi:tRNA(fMet)-specific endonuclease VapC